MQKRYKLIFNGLFFLVIYILLFKVVKPQLIFHFNQSGFIFDAYILKDYLGYPGGIIEYFSQFIFDFNTIPWLGALMYVLLLVLIVLFLHKILTTKENEANVILKYIPAFILGLLLSKYSFPFVIVVNVLLLLFFIFLYHRIATTKLNSIFKICFAFLVFPLAYYILGGFSFVIFIVSNIIIELIGKGKLRTIKIITILFLGTIIPIVSANNVFFISVSDAFLQLVPYFSAYAVDFLLYALFVSVPFLIITQRILNILPERWKGLKHSQIIQYLLIPVIFLILFFVKFDEKERQKIEIDRFAYLGEWEKILENVNKNPSDDRLVCFQTNRALFHTGKMPDELFNYSQKWGIDGLFLTRFFTYDILLPSSQLYLDLAYVNEAIHLGNEAISYSEKSPQIIQQLIKSYIISNNYQSAKLYINILKKYPFFKNEALKYEQMIKNDLPEKAMLKLRNLMPYTNFRVSQLPASDDILSLIIDHPENKMAYEYLMSYYLLNNDIASFIVQYSRGKDLNYGKLPRIYQEAIVLFIYNLNKTGKPVPIIKLDDDVLADFADYMRLLNLFDGSLEEAEPFLFENYGKTYWYYLHYTSPVSNNSQVVAQ